MALQCVWQHLRCLRSWWTICLVLSALTWAPVHTQEATQREPQRSVVRWSRAHTTSKPQESPCEYKDLMTSLHDRVSILATLDEDQRSRLEKIDQKIVQFELSNLARLESLKVQQMDFLKRLENMDLTQRMIKRQMNDFKEPNATRSTRQAVTSFAAQNDSLKLDALATLLASTSIAISKLQTQLEANITRLTQTTSNLQRRINNLQRRQNNGYAGGSSYLPPHTNYYGPTDAPLVKSCADGATPTNGVLRLQLTANSEPFYVFCDDEPFGGGWTVVLNRFNGDENFQRGWLDYKSGFGNLAGEFFIGLDKLHALTAAAVHELLIVLQDFDGMTRYARYNLFAVGNEEEEYALKLLGAYEGDAGDAFTYHAGRKFSTFDNDNDGCVDCNCAQSHMGAWWYNWCEMSNLNGKYYEPNEQVAVYTGMYWHHFRGPTYSLKSAKMLIRPVSAERDSQRRR